MRTGSAILVLIVVGALANLYSGLKIKRRSIIEIGEDRNVSEAFEFVESNGGFVSPWLEFRSTPGKGVGIFFKSQVVEQDFNKRGFLTMFRIPRDVLLCNESAGVDDDLHKSFIKAYLYNQSFFGSFFRSLPKVDEVVWRDWSDKDIERLNNNALKMRLEALRTTKMELYQQIRAEFGNVISFDEFANVEFYVESRSFNVDQWFCFVPLADLPNHYSHGLRSFWGWEYDENGKAYYVMETEVKPVPNSEFSIIYNMEMSNEESLLGYGFVDIDNPFQKIDWNLPKSTTFYDIKVAKFPKVVLTYDVDIEWLLIISRIGVATQEEFAQVLSDLTLVLKQPVGLQREKDAAQFCSKNIREEYPKEKLLSLEFAYKYDLSLSNRERMAIAYQISYLRLFERAASFCDELNNFLSCISRRKFRRLWRLKLGRTVPRTYERLRRLIYVGGENGLCR